ncbi:MAG: hypothetical protein HPY61_04545 [Methanotrichaceae archaeon]|nr:hypothetical protein [Methanotrichaceae archaeon]
MQGDVLREVKFSDWDWDTEKNEVIIYEKKLPYIVVLTQDCDLEQDFKCRTTAEKNDDKILQAILVCPAYGWEDFIKGDHLKDFNLKMESINSNKRNLIKTQQVARFHYLEEDPESQIPSLVIDFKHYYTLPVEFLCYIYKRHYVTSMNELFRESLSQRFSFYLSRIGLPEIKRS